MQRGLQRQRLAIDGKAQTRHGLVKQPVEGTRRRLRLFEEQLFQLVVELIGLFHQQIVDPRLVVRQRLGLELLSQRYIIDAVQFQFEEQQLRRYFGELGIDVTIEFGAA